MKKTLLAALGMLLLLLGGGLLGLYQVGTDAKAYLAVSRETADYGYIGLSKGQTDEALTGLDDAAKARCLAAIDRAVGPQKTLVMACHDPAEAAALAARTVPVA